MAGNLSALYHVAALEDALRAASIAVVRLKGSAYLGRLYESLDRWMVDVDLLVRPSQRDAARHVLERFGYHLVPPPRGWRFSWRQHYNWQFNGDGTMPMVELHTALCSHGMFRIDHDGLFDRRVCHSDGQRSVWTLSPEDALLHTAVHVVKDAYLHDERLAEDSRRMIETWSPEWEVVCERAGQWGVTVGLAYVLNIARTAGAPVPSAVFDALAPTPMSSIARAIFNRAAPLHSRVPRLMKLAALSLEHDAGPRLARLVPRYARRRATDAIYALPSEPTSGGFA